MSTQRAHKSAYAGRPLDAVTKLRLSAGLLTDATVHAQARGETLSAFARRALERQILRDRQDDYGRRVRRVTPHNLFEA